MTRHGLGANDVGECRTELDSLDVTTSTLSFGFCRCRSRRIFLGRCSLLLRGRLPIFIRIIRIRTVGHLLAPPTTTTSSRCLLLTSRFLARAVLFVTPTAIILLKPCHFHIKNWNKTWKWWIDYAALRIVFIKFFKLTTGILSSWFFSDFLIFHVTLLTVTIL